MKIIPLTQGMVAIVDDHQFEKLNQYEWYAKSFGTRWYAARNTPWGRGPRQTILMHREIMGAPKLFEVDHIHRDDALGVIDNRKTNLRLATKKQNIANQRKRDNCSSSFKGVSWRKKGSFWTAYIKPADQKMIHLGCFRNEKDAALAYDNAAKKYFGEFAHLNFNQQQKQ